MKPRAITILVYFVFFLCSSSQGTQYLEAYGDSVTAGLVSHTDVTAAPSLKIIGDILSDFVMFKLTGNEGYLTPHHDRNSAWPKLLSDLLEKDLGEKVELANYAVSGSHTVDLFHHVKKASVQSPQAKGFIFTGHNDLCNNQESPQQIAQDYAKSMKPAIELWDSRHTDATLYLIPMGDIPRVYDTLQGYVWHKSSEGEYRCEDSWKRYFPYCRRYADLQAQGKLKSHLGPKLQAMNASLKQFEASFKSSRGNKVAFLENVHDTDYLVEQFAVDCFHLSKRGQQAVAQRVFEDLKLF